MNILTTRKAVGHTGASTVEFALILPLFFILIFGIMDFGWYFFVQHTLQFSTREGVRLALVGRQLDDGEGGKLSREESIITTIKDKVSLAIDPAKLAIYIFPVDSNYDDPANWESYGGDEENPGSPDAGDPGHYMRVRTKYSYDFLTPMVGIYFPDGKISIQADATYRNEIFE